MAIFARAAVVLSLIFTIGYSTKPPTYHTFVHLFEWKWPDIARECEEFLGPAGYKAVQISPPHEHVQGEQWWVRYQPVSYKLISRGGNRESFKDMVSRCTKVGVDIYVDAIINHMAGRDSGTGVGGSTYKEYNFPAVPFGYNDFNHICEKKYGFKDIRNYQDIEQVRNCELVQLDDLNLGSTYVRTKVAEYLNHLLMLGVKGFRFDAAKHMWPGDLNAIKALLPAGTYIYNEVIAQPMEPIQPLEYYGIGDVTDFSYGKTVADHMSNGRFSNLVDLNDKWDGFVRYDKALIFLENHDNERPGHGGGGNVMKYSDGKRYELAAIYMLGYNFGYPKVMSSYDIRNGEHGPPSFSPYSAGSIKCGFNDEWKCQHRWTPIANMVRFRLVAGNEVVTNKVKINTNAFAFGRGNKAFLVLNNGATTLSANLKTGLPAGRYCNIIAHNFKDGKCTGDYTEITSSGIVSVSVPSVTAAAFHIEASESLRTTAPTPTPTPTPTPSATKKFDQCGTSSAKYQTMFVRGTFNNWASTPMKLAGNNLWTASGLVFESGSNMRFKFDVAGDWVQNYGDNSGDGIADKLGEDITVPCVGNYNVAFNDLSGAYFLIPASA